MLNQIGKSLWVLAGLEPTPAADIVMLTGSVLFAGVDDSTQQLADALFDVDNPNRLGDYHYIQNEENSDGYWALREVETTFDYASRPHPLPVNSYSFTEVTEEKLLSALESSRIMKVLQQSNGEDKLGNRVVDLGSDGIVYELNDGKTRLYKSNGEIIEKDPNGDLSTYINHQGSIYKVPVNAEDGTKNLSQAIRINKNFLEYNAEFNVTEASGILESLDSRIASIAAERQKILAVDPDDPVLQELAKEYFTEEYDRLVAAREELQEKYLVPDDATINLLSEQEGGASVDINQEKLLDEWEDGYVDGIDGQNSLGHGINGLTGLHLSQQDIDDIIQNNRVILERQVDALRDALASGDELSVVESGLALLLSADNREEASTNGEGFIDRENEDHLIDTHRILSDVNDLLAALDEGGLGDQAGAALELLRSFDAFDDEAEGITEFADSQAAQNVVSSLEVLDAINAGDWGAVLGEGASLVSNLGGDFEGSTLETIGNISSLYDSINSGNWSSALTSGTQLYNQLSGDEIGSGGGLGTALSAVGLYESIDDGDWVGALQSGANLYNQFNGAGTDGDIGAGTVGQIANVVNLVDNWGDQSDLQRAGSLVETYNSFSGGSAGAVGSAISFASAVESGIVGVSLYFTATVAKSFSFSVSGPLKKN